MYIAILSFRKSTKAEIPVLSFKVNLKTLKYVFLFLFFFNTG